MRLERRRKLKKEFLNVYNLRDRSPCSRNSPPLWTPWILRPLLGKERKERGGGRGRRRRSVHGAFPSSFLTKHTDAHALAGQRIG